MKQLHKIMIYMCDFRLQVYFTRAVVITFMLVFEAIFHDALLKRLYHA